ncbi:MAG TPA: hypothetical protein VF556_13350 [Pyrinomonadaceae bacterium]|jgi:hypothetical protein
MNELDQETEQKLHVTFRNLSPKNQQKVLDYLDFLIWLDQKRKPDVSDESEKPNDNQS